MKNLLIPVFVTMLLAACNTATAQRNDHYITNRSPLVAQPYTSLPLGAIKPHGFLNKMLELQRDGLTGYLDSIYEVVCGPNNGWLGGTGDGWERGPYWLDGLVPLAYILDDEELKAKAQEWIEWSIENQREDGYFGPVPLAEGYEKIEGTQQGNREDWWPKMVMLKVLQQYYTATGDERVIDLMTDYFRYQLDNLDEYPLGHWTYWANRRGGDNMAVVYWLYNITGEEFLLDLSEKLFEQTYNWTEVYSGNDIRSLSPLPHLHCVNVAQGLKQPVIYYQQHPEKKYLDAVKLGLNSLKEVHGWVNGMYGGDERLHGNEPTQGSELCSAVEMMYSFENILPITGDIYYAGYLEKVAYNVLPTQHDDDFTRKQYFQQANQVLISDQKRNFFNDEYSRIVYGVLTGYPCCTANMHQGWPKFIQNLWYATADNGLAALVYGPSEVTAKVAGGKEVKMIQTT
ncbi:MAG: beta-L-arabinofuranosidase domain-containing protein, partial [Bacteroidales bacterium]